MPGDADSGRGDACASWSRMPLAETARLWAAEPDVIADPSQLDDGRVWTRAKDVLPGRDVSDQVLHAAFGDLSFLGTAAWDAEELGTLWLTPVGPTSGRPCADVSVARAALATLRASGADTGSLEALVEDLLRTVETLVGAVDAHRATAQELVALLERPDGVRLRGSHADHVLDRLYRQARRPRGGLA